MSFVGIAVDYMPFQFYRVELLTQKFQPCQLVTIEPREMRDNGLCIHILSQESGIGGWILGVPGTTMYERVMAYTSVPSTVRHGYIDYMMYCNDAYLLRIS